MLSWLLVLAGVALIGAALLRVLAVRRRGVEVGVMRGPGDKTGVLLALGGLGLLLLSGAVGDG